jgi:hypothetical protein
VESRAISPRQPEVPNLMFVIVGKRSYPVFWPRKTGETQQNPSGIH